MNRTFGDLPETGTRASPSEVESEHSTLGTERVESGKPRSHRSDRQCPMPGREPQETEPRREEP